MVASTAMNRRKEMNRKTIAPKVDAACAFSVNRVDEREGCLRHLGPTISNVLVESMA